MDERLRTVTMDASMRGVHEHVDAPSCADCRHVREGGVAREGPNRWTSSGRLASRCALTSWRGQPAAIRSSAALDQSDAGARQSSGLVRRVSKQSNHCVVPIESARGGNTGFDTEDVD